MSTESQQLKNVLKTRFKKFFPKLLFTLALASFISVMALEATGYLTIAIVMSGSMQKGIPAGSLVVFVKADEYNVGDVIAFKVYNSIVMHRVANVTDKGFRTKGDDNVSLDPWVIPKDAIKGKLLFFLPLFGTFILIARTPLVFAAFSTIIFVELTRSKFFQENERETG